MIFHNKKSSKVIHNALETLGNGGEDLLRTTGISGGVIQEIHRILNIYSYKPPQLIYDIIVSTLSIHASQNALLRLERYLETAGKDAIIHSYNPGLPDILAAIFAMSGALSGRLNSDGTLLGDLADLENPLVFFPDKGYYMNHIKSIFKPGELITETVKKIHRLHTIHLMRICARNSDSGVPITEISIELSSLAEAVIEVCLEIAARELYERTGTASRPHTLAVFGLGKLGGRELNVSSDVDLIYLCSDHEATWGNYDSITFHTMLAEHLTRLLTEATAQGALYRVDTRLRADGASGPLVRSGKDYFRYLELRGAGWERQMPLKARPVAGD